MRNLNKGLIFRDLYVHIKCAAITANKSDALPWLLSLRALTHFIYCEIGLRLSLVSTPNEAVGSLRRSIFVPPLSSGFFS